MPFSQLPVVLYAYNVQCTCTNSMSFNEIEIKHAHSFFLGALSGVWSNYDWRTVKESCAQAGRDFKRKVGSRTIDDLFEADN